LFELEARLAKHMSKTLAAEIAGRTVEVTNPANRAMALAATLRRHGFDAGLANDAPVGDRAELQAWLQTTFASKG
jgi:hypothetical protein